MAHIKSIILRAGLLQAMIFTTILSLSVMLIFMPDLIERRSNFSWGAPILIIPFFLIMLIFDIVFFFAPIFVMSLYFADCHIKKLNKSIYRTSLLGMIAYIINGLMLFFLIGYIFSSDSASLLNKNFVILSAACAIGGYSACYLTCKKLF